MGNNRLGSGELFPTDTPIPAERMIGREEEVAVGAISSSPGLGALARRASAMRRCSGLLRMAATSPRWICFAWRMRQSLPSVSSWQRSPTGAPAAAGAESAARWEGAGRSRRPYRDDACQRRARRGVGDCLPAWPRRARPRPIPGLRAGTATADCERRWAAARPLSR